MDIRSKKDTSPKVRHGIPRTRQLILIGLGNREVMLGTSLKPTNCVLKPSNQGQKLLFVSLNMRHILCYFLALANHPQIHHQWLGMKNHPQSW